MKELPIACSLDGASLESRYQELAALGKRSLIAAERDPSGSARLRFRGGEDTRSSLERIIAAESECCAFLELRLSGEDPLELTIEGPDGAEPVIGEMVDAFSAEAVS